MPESTDAAKLSELAADISIAMLTTLDDNGNFVSRPMGQQEVEPDGTLWFFSERDSSVIAQIQANPHVGVTLSSSDTWISINGSAEVVVDTAKQRIKLSPPRNFIMRADEAAKDPAAEVPSLDSWRSLLEEVAE